MIPTVRAVILAVTVVIGLAACTKANPGSVEAQSTRLMSSDGGGGGGGGGGY